MKCPGCKRESSTTDYCEWCFNFLSSQAVVASPVIGLDMAAVHAMSPGAHAAAPAWQPVGAGPLTGGGADPLPPANWQAPASAAPAAAAQSNVRYSLTGEVIVEEAPPPPMPPLVPGGPAPPIVPGSPIPPGAYSGRPGAPVGVPPAGIHPRFAEAIVDTIDYGEAWEKLLAIALPVVVASLLIVKFVPTSFMWVAFGAFFLVGLATGSSRAIETYEDAFLDVAAALFAIYFLGPFGGLIAYALVGAIKREWNGALLAILVGHLIVRFIFMIAFSQDAGFLTVMPSFGYVFDPEKFMAFLPICLSFAGWICSSFFRPINE